MTFEMGKKCMDFIMKNVQEANINQLGRKSRTALVSFWGGEPLLEWDLIQQLVEYGENSEFKDVVVNFTGTTNGTLMTIDKLSFLRDHQIAFMVSIDGTQETHDRYRKSSEGVGSHAIIMKNMEKALKYFPKLRARMSPYPERIDHFYEDVKYLVERGFYHLMFSPVYELDWRYKTWETWKTECFKVVDLIMYLRRRGIEMKIEHFTSYQIGTQRYPCGAGRWYMGFDYDGAIYPCHRFAKVSDTRPWQEKETCIGHVDVGITRPEFRTKFLNWNAEDGECEKCPFVDTSPCAGGCYGTNFDLTGDMAVPSKSVCSYIKMQKEVSAYLKFCLQREQQDMVNELNKVFTMSQKSKVMEDKKPFTFNKS
jgi:uncharacterized protein